MTEDVVLLETGPGADPKPDGDAPSESLLALVESEPTAPPLEWMMYFGVPVDKARAVEEDKVTPATQGRLKIPLSKLISNQNLETQHSDNYISLVCLEQVNENRIRASDMLITGSTEIFLEFVDPTPINGLRIETLKGACLLVLNPRLTHVATLSIPSLKNCMRIGRLSEFEPCGQPDCNKPVFVPRDGTCCFKHASRRAGMRLSVVGGDHGGDSAVVVKQKPKPVIDAAQREILREVNRRSELIARKKTAVLLANRRSEGKQNPFIRHNRGTDLMELGDDIGESVETKEVKIARFEKLKRKRELIEKRAEQSEMEERAGTVALVPVDAQVPSRVSLLGEFDKLVQHERGMN